MNLDIFTIGIVAEALFLLIVLILIWRRVAFDERTEVPVCRKVRDAASGIAKEHIPAPVFRAMQIENRMFRSVCLFVTRKMDLPSGAKEIPYGKDWRVTGVFLAAIAFVEIVSMDMVCVHFAGARSAIRVLVLILSIYGFVWCLGFVVGSKTMPCYAIEEGIVLRCGIMHRIEIPWECVSSVCLKKVELEKRSGLIRSGRHLYLNNAFQANELTLCIYEDSKVIINGKPSKDAILKISFSADNPSAAKRIIEGYLDK